MGSRVVRCLLSLTLAGIALVGCNGEQVPDQDSIAGQLKDATGAPDSGSKRSIKPVDGANQPKDK